MDAPLTAAARALEMGDPLRALDRIALREDATALALRGIAMAQLGDYGRARTLLRRARRAFGVGDALASARCVTAEAEVALAARALAFDVGALASAARVLADADDRDNAARASLLLARHALLLGDVEEAERVLAQHDARDVSALTTATAALLGFDIALRRGTATLATVEIERARRAAVRTGIASLVQEVEDAAERLYAPLARRLSGEVSTPLNLAALERTLERDALVIDARSRRARSGGEIVSLVRRPVLLGLLTSLARVWPLPEPRDSLIASAFGARHVHPSLRVRLRVEIGRLRALIRPLADVVATPEGYVLLVDEGREVVVVAPIEDGVDASLLSLLEDGTAWPTAGLALALGTSPRTVQRAIASLEERALVITYGKGRARRVVLRMLGETASASRFVAMA